MASPPAQQAPDNVHEVAEVERSLLQTLSWWAACSIIGGGSLWLIGGRTGRPTLRAFGRQTALWGAVNAVIAGAGTALQRAGARQRSAEELRRLLLVNAALDVGYMAGGASLVVARARVGQRPRYSAPQAVGDGTAIIIQGGFLTASDLIHTARLGTRAGSGRDA